MGHPHFGRHFRPILIAAILVLSGACSSHEPEEPAQENLRTLFIYMPWSTTLLNAFKVNLSDFEKAIINRKGLGNQRVLVYLASSSTQASLYEIHYSGNTCTRTSLKEYNGRDYTTTTGLTTILNDVKREAPATQAYSMIIGGHGLGWVPVNTGTTRADGTRIPMHWDGENPKTRYFGGTSSSCQTDISTLREAMEAASFHTDYLLFDACYMSGIETAYELRSVTDRLIAPTSEMMADGIPYERVGTYLLGTPDYEALCREFINFYSTYSTPSGTLTVTDCTALDALASAMLTLNSNHDPTTVNPDSLQRLCGYTPGLFYDFGDYIRHLCPDSTERQEAESVLAAAILYSGHTPYIYTEFTNNSFIGQHYIKLNTFSGLTVSEPSRHRYATSCYKSTSWYAATH